MKSSFIQYVEQRLQHWAKWFSTGNSYGIGYPRRSTEHVLMTEGFIDKSSVPNPVPCNEEAEEIEAFVLEMALQNEKMATLLRYHYFEPGSLRIQANNFSREHGYISHNTFKDYVDMARQWIAGRLSAARISKMKNKGIAL